MKNPSVWIAGYNMPGYLPDSDPVECESFEDAKQQVIEFLNWALDDADTQSFASQIEFNIGVIESITEPEEFNVRVGAYVYFVSQA